MDYGNGRDGGPHDEFIGRDLLNHVPEHSCTVRPGADGKYKIISFFTRDDVYADLAARLEAGLQKHGLEYVLVGMESIGPWELNCAFKARFVREQWEKSDIPVVWLDADATVEQEPAWFRKMTCDFALHKWEGWQFSSGTVYFGKSDRAKALIDQWMLRCEADPVTWDQISLQLAWMDVASIMPLRTVWLPRSYCAIFDKDPHGPPVLKHWQASRKSKILDRTVKRPQFDFLPEFKDDARNNRIRESLTAFSFLGDAARTAFERVLPPLPMEFYEELGPIVSRFRSVAEIGCGEGHLSAYFSSDMYSGLEENPQTLLQARKLHPDRHFRNFSLNPKQDFPKTETLLFPPTFAGWGKEETVDVLLRAAKRARTVIVAGERAEDIASTVRGMKAIGLKVAAVRPMKFRRDEMSAPYSIVVLKRTLRVKMRRLMNRLLKWTAKEIKQTAV